MKKNKLKQSETELVREHVLSPEELYLLQYLKDYNRSQANEMTYEIEFY